MPPIGYNVLTHSALDTARKCLRMYRLRYELGLRPTRTTPPLRIGSAVHAALAVRTETDSADDAQKIIQDIYQSRPEGVEEYEWDRERAMVQELVRGYVRHYHDDGLPRETKTEVFWRMPLINPKTGKPSRTFGLAGRFDGLVPREELWFLLERKTTNEAIDIGARYWLRTRVDSQISLYCCAAEYAGYPVGGVIYDVLHKPDLRLCQVPILDDDGLKVIVDADGTRATTKAGTPRQTGGEGLTVLRRDETAEEFGARVRADIEARPNCYFARQVLVRLADDLVEFLQEVWEIAKWIMDCRLHGRWFRNVGRQCDYCDYADLCLQSIRIEPGQNPPQGFQFVDDVHPELGKDT